MEKPLAYGSGISDFIVNLGTKSKVMKTSADHYCKIFETVCCVLNRYFSLSS